MNNKEGNVNRQTVEGQETASGMHKETFGTGTAAQSEVGKKGGEGAKELEARIMADPSGFGQQGGSAKKSEAEEELKINSRHLKKKLMFLSVDLPALEVMMLHFVKLSIRKSS